MKYEIYRMMRDWTTWILLFLSIILVIGYSAVYFDKSENVAPTWNYYVDAYKNDADIRAQIEKNQGEISEIEEIMRSDASSIDEDSANEHIALLSSSNKILKYLEGKTVIYPYSSVCDGSMVVANAKDRRSYAGQALEMVFIFQLIALVFLVGQIVNQRKTSGTFVFSLIMRGRKVMFKRQLLASFGVFTVGFLLQFGMVSLVRTLLNSGAENVLYFDGNNVTMMSEMKEFLLLALSLYVILISFWAITFFISQIIDNLLVFSVSSLIANALLMMQILTSKIPFVSNMHMAIPDILSEGGSVGMFCAVQIVRALLIAVCLVGAYFVCKHKNYRMRYE